MSGAAPDTSHIRSPRDPAAERVAVRREVQDEMAWVDQVVAGHSFT